VRGLYSHRCSRTLFCNLTQLAWVDDVLSKLRRFWKRWWITSARKDVDRCAEWLQWKNFNKNTSEEIGEEDHIVVLGRGWLGPSEENGEGHNLASAGTMGVPGEKEEDCQDRDPTTRVTSRLNVRDGGVAGPWVNPAQAEGV